MVNDYLSIDPKKVTYNEKKRITNLLSPHCGFVVRDLGVVEFSKCIYAHLKLFVLLMILKFPKFTLFAYIVVTFLYK